jgi:hypothetical protein
VQVEADNRTIVWRLTNFAIRDFHDVVSALQPGERPSLPATISLAIRWTDVLDVVEMRDTQNQFAAVFIERTATVQWEADQADFKFVSDAAETSKNLYSLTAEERNGSFFS